MPFPKLTVHLQEALDRQEHTAPLPLQEKILAPIKSGADLICLGSEGTGRTTALIISVIQMMKSEAKGETPRALIFVKDKEAALELEAAFNPFLFRTDLRIFSAYDQHDVIGQRDTIFEGVDILIGTPARLCKLFFMNGINLALLRMLIIDDAEFLSKTTGNSEIIRIVQAGHKCQKILFTKSIHPRVQQLIDTIMPRARKYSE